MFPQSTVKQATEQDEVVEEEARLARDERLELVFGTQVIALTKKVKRQTTKTISRKA